MANIPNIPSVVVTIEDRSYLEPILTSGRTILTAFFSKYGSEDIESWATFQEFESKFGKANIRKYGISQAYIEGQGQFTQSFLGKRLLPDDATYANKTVNFSADGTLFTDVAGATDETTVETASPDKTFGFVAKGRGSGYNDIVIKFSPLTEYSKFYADDNGLEKYKFNFLEATIYEKQDNGVLIQIEQNPVPFALVSEDPTTGAGIQDIYDGQTLNPVDRFDLISNFVSTFIKDDTYSLENLLGFEQLNTPVFWDDAMQQKCILAFEDGDLTVVYVDLPQEAVESVRVHWVDSTGADRYTKISVNDKNIVLVDDTAAGAGVNDIESFLIDSEYAYYEVTMKENGIFGATGTSVFTAVAVSGQTSIDTGLNTTGCQVILNNVVLTEGTDYTESNGVITFTEPLNYGDEIKVISAGTDEGLYLTKKLFERYNLWYSLIKNGIELSQGEDGANLYLNGMLNFDGPGTTTSQNAKMLIIDFYQNNPEIREILYPKYDFDYIVDWTQDPDVQMAIANLTDYLQTAMGIHSCGIHYDYKQDIDYRKYNFGISSFNNMLYSGQANKKHYLALNGRNIVMPSNFYAILDHLYVDSVMDIAEPVAGINKGSLRTGSIKLTYTPTSLEIEKLRQKQINAIIDEPDGVYFIDQLTAYKKASILSRAHAVKPIHRIKKDLRSLLKDVLQSKDGNTAVKRAATIIDSYMKQWVYNDKTNRSGAFEYYNHQVIFDENKLTINVLLTVKPLRSVEKVNVTIAVV